MTHQEYIEAIEKQQSAINRLLKTRKARLAKIQSIVSERYSELLGKFFKADDKIIMADNGEYYYILRLTLNVNHEVEVVCRHFGLETQGFGDNTRVVGISHWLHTFKFRKDDDIIKIIEPMFVSKEEAMRKFDELVEKVKDGYLSF